MEIIVGLLVILVLIIAIGKMKGPPNPRDMSDIAILARIQSESAWLRKYEALDFTTQQKSNLKKMYSDKSKYISELVLELNNRHGEESKETILPTIQRALELNREGMEESEAKSKAIDELLTQQNKGK